MRNHHAVGIAVATMLASCADRGEQLDHAAPTMHPQLDASPDSNAVPPAPSGFEVRFGMRRFTPPARAADWNVLLADDAERHHLLVQFHRVPDVFERAELEQAGISLLHPLGARAYLASARRVVDPAAPALALIRWAGPIERGDKLDPALALSKPGLWARREAGRVDLVAKLFTDGNIERAAAEAERLGGRILGKAPAAGVFAVSLPEASLGELAALGDVRRLEPLSPPGDGESNRARTFIGATSGAIPAGEADGSGIVVGVFDSQHAWTGHQDFGGRVSQGDMGAARTGIHATMTAGMIAGSGALSNQGVFRGIAPAATIRSYSFVNSTPNDPVSDYLGDVDDAVTNDGVRIANNSWGDSGCTNHPYGEYDGRAPFLDGIVHDSGVAVVFSAGNERAGFFNSSTNANDTSCIGQTTSPFANYGTINHPKPAKNVFAVGAIDSANSAMSNYSSWGPTLDGRLKPELVAAGHHDGAASNQITSITNPFGMPTGAANQQGYRTPNFTTATSTFDYAWFTQTSAAAAMASGAMALLVDAWHRQFPNRPEPLPSTLRALLVHRASDLDDSTTWYNPGPDYASGYGVMQVNESVASLERGEAMEDSVGDGASGLRFLAVPPGTASLKITLAWDDPAALEGANPALVNDLDLVVTDPAGTRHFPWTLDPANPASDAQRTAEDHLNNLEQVVIDTGVMAGTWRVEIRGTSVPEGPQLFSVVSDVGPVRRPVDLVLALDTSGSMNEQASPGLTRISLLEQAATLVLETWRLHAVDEDRGGILSFNSNVTTAPPTAPALQPFIPNATALSNAAGNLTASGCTAMGGALQVGFDALGTSSINKRSILLFSDGMQTANPFIGEQSSRLKIQTVSTSATPPFGSWFCTTTTATGPSGAPIAPDNQFLDEHGVEIHTIGVGVNGQNFQTLLSRIADETHGLHHFTSEPDADLDLFYTNDLVRALKSTTLEIITTDAGTLDAASPRRDVVFSVNPTVKSITMVLSWRGPVQRSAISAAMVGPDGTVLAPDKVTQQGYFTLFKFDLPGGRGAKPGTWRLSLARDLNPAAQYQLSILGDESCFHFDFRTSPTRNVAGRPLRFEARLSSYGRPPAKPLDVRVRLSPPPVSSGNLLSEWVPKTRVWQAVFPRLAAEHVRVDQSEAVLALLERAVSELAVTPAFVSAMRRKDPIDLALVDNGDRRLGDPRAGDGLYVAQLPNVAVAGSYDLTWTIRGVSACGPILRQELSTELVAAGSIDPTKTLVTLVPGPSGTTMLTVRPVDASGNLVGPGHATTVGVKSMGLKALGGVLDRGDGTYTQVVEGKAELSDFHITVGGMPLVRIPLIRTAL